MEGVSTAGCGWLTVAVSWVRLVVKISGVLGALGVVVTTNSGREGNWAIVRRDAWAGRWWVV